MKFLVFITYTVPSVCEVMCTIQYIAENFRGNKVLRICAVPRKFSLMGVGHAWNGCGT